MLVRGVTPQLVPVLLVALGLLIWLARTVVGWHWPVPLSVDEAQYLAWSYDLQAGYYSKPPFIAWALSAASSVCAHPNSASAVLGPSEGAAALAAVEFRLADFGIEACARWLQPLAFLIASLATAATTYRLSGSVRFSIWAGLLLLSSPLASFYSQAATTDAWLLLWWSAALLCLAQATQTDPQRISPLAQQRLGWWLACGLCLGLGLLTKYSMGVFALAGLAFLVAQRQWRLLSQPGPWLAAGLALLIFLPNLLWNAQWGWPTLRHHADITVGQGHGGLHLMSLVSWFSSQFLLFSPLVFLVFLWVTLRHLQSLRPVGLGLGRTSGHHLTALPVTFSWAILLVVGLQALLSRAHTNWAAPALVGISIAVALACHQATAQTLGPPRTPAWVRMVLWGSLGLNLISGAALLSSPWSAPALGLSGSRATDPFIRLTGFKEVAVIASQVAMSSQAPVSVAAQDRSLLASLAAYNPELRVYADNPGQLLDNHWQLQHDLGRARLPPGSEVLLLVVAARNETGATTPSAGETLAQRFPRVTPLEVTHPLLAERLSQVVLAGRPENLVLGFWVHPEQHR